MAHFDILPVGLERRLPAFCEDFGRRLMLGAALILLLALLSLLLLIAEARGGDMMHKTAVPGLVPGCVVTDRNPCSTLVASRTPPAAGPLAHALAFGRPPAGIVSQVDAAAFAAGVPAGIAHAVVKHESGYKPHVRGAAGEWGLGQIKCQTARGLGFAGACAALRDPATNLRWSMTYLKLALDRGGAGCAGVSLYNTGIHARPRCTAYGRIVMARAR